MRNNNYLAGDPHEALAVGDVMIVGNGQAISFPRQLVWGGADDERNADGQGSRWALPLGDASSPKSGN